MDLTVRFLVGGVVVSFLQVDPHLGQPDYLTELKI